MTVGHSWYDPAGRMNVDTGFTCVHYGTSEYNPMLKTWEFRAVIRKKSSSEAKRLVCFYHSQAPEAHPIGN